MANWPKIYVDAGHGGGDPGAVGGPGFREEDLNLKAAKYCKNFLSAYECEVIMSRETDIDVKVADRIRQAKASGVKASLCIHHNAGGGDGGEVFFWHTDSVSKTLAALTAQEFKAIGQNLRTGSGMPEGVKPSIPNSRQNFGMCRELSARGIPAILGEFAFVDNYKDRAIVDTDAELKAEGEAYGKAVVKFLGLRAKAPICSKPSKAGDVLVLSNVSLYASSTTSKEAKKVTGRYFLYDDKTFGTRRRITSSAERVNKFPAWSNVTGYINVSDVK